MNPQITKAINLSFLRADDPQQISIDLEISDSQVKEIIESRFYSASNYKKYFKNILRKIEKVDFRNAEKLNKILRTAIYGAFVFQTGGPRGIITQQLVEIAKLLDYFTWDDTQIIQYLQKLKQESAEAISLIGKNMSALSYNKMIFYIQPSYPNLQPLDTQQLNSNELKKRLQLRLVITENHDNSSNDTGGIQILKDGYAEMFGHLDQCQSQNQFESLQLINKLQNENLNQQNEVDNLIQQDIEHKALVQNQNREIKALKNKVQQLLANRQQSQQEYQQFIPVNHLLIRSIGSGLNSAVYQYDGLQFKRIQFLEQIIESGTCCTLLEDSSLFICGGYTQDSSCIITIQNQIQRMPQMIKLRAHAAIIKQQGKIYIFGGFRQSWIKEAEYFDIECRQWFPIASLPCGRGYCGAAYYNGDIYIGGGSCQQSVKNDEILKYNIQSNNYVKTRMRAPNNTEFGSILFVIDAILYCMRGDKMYSYNIVNEHHLAIWDIPQYFWWSCMPPKVRSEGVYFALTYVSSKFVRLDYRKGEVKEIGSLETGEDYCANKCVVFQFYGQICQLGNYESFLAQQCQTRWDDNVSSEELIGNQKCINLYINKLNFAILQELAHIQVRFNKGQKI